MVRGEIPIQADKEILDRMKKDIFLFAQSVDLSSEKFAGNKSGVALGFLYSGLRMNANQTEMFAYNGLQMFSRLFQRYLEIMGEMPETEDETGDEINFKFNETMIKDIEMLVNLLNQSYGRISNKTYLSNHPYVEDVDTEMEETEDDLNDRLERADREVNNEEEPTENVTPPEEEK